MVWDSGWLPASFVGTALTLGGVASAGWLAGSSDTADSSILHPLAGAILAGSLALLMSAFWMFARAWHVRGEQLAAGHLDPPAYLFTSSRLLSLGIYVLLVGVLPIFFAAYFWFGAAGQWTPPFVYAAYLSVGFGAILGRRLIYSLTT